MLSPRTAKYVEALVLEGDDFDYFKWLRRVREEEAQAKQFPATCFLGELPPSEIGDLTNTPDLRDVRAISAPVLHAKSPPTARGVHRSDHKAQRDSPQDLLRRRLIRVSDAFDEFQGSRVRDAVYGYLKTVFALVVDCKGRRQTTRLLRRAFQFAGLPLDKNADPFATVIRCTSERNVDNKAISKWARALRYAAHFKRTRTPLKTFIKKMGGINACAERYTIYLGRGSQ
jgi:hypothetical protein